ncbi:MAG: four helix bundle protein [Cyclobacteriaceae bacterium]|nr:four helix bundle protein [Cyclobacteriaceae bacterium]MDX5465557.1 four helix bundle protein [Cyclobacteriaceae bacterium]
MEKYQANFKFENLQIWQKAMDFGEDIFKVTASFPKEEVFNLTSQARRAVDSIALNIAEGSISQSNPEYLKFIGYAIRSLAEVVTCLHKAKRRNYLDDVKFMQLYQESFHLMNMMQSFKSKIK